MGFNKTNYLGNIKQKIEYKILNIHYNIISFGVRCIYKYLWNNYQIDKN